MSAKLLNVVAGAVTVQQRTLMVRSADPVTNHSLPWSNAMQRTHLCSSTCAHQFQSPCLRGAPQLRPVAGGCGLLHAPLPMLCSFRYSQLWGAAPCKRLKTRDMLCICVV